MCISYISYIKKNMIEDFKELYFVNLDRYLIESENILEITDKIIYWKTKKYEYKKRYIELSSKKPWGQLKLTMGTVGLGALENNLFEKLCDSQIELLEIETKYLTSINNQPQQMEINKPDEVKKELHNNIFKGNAFEVWQSMFNEFKIKDGSYSTDIDFMFEVMKYNNLIHENIGLTDIKNWINGVYEISFEKIRHTNPKSTANEKRLIIYNNIKSK